MVRDTNNQIICKKNNEGYMGEYLTTAELSKRIKMSPGTIRNLVWKKELKENYHYLKPTPRKLLFIWDKVESWLQKGPVLEYTNPDTNHKGLIHI
jgi:hypothetical protein